MVQINKIYKKIYGGGASTYIILLLLVLSPRIVPYKCTPRTAEEEFYSVVRGVLFFSEKNKTQNNIAL